MEGLKIESICGCSEKYDIVTAQQFLNYYKDKTNKLKGNCQIDKNHKNIPAQFYCCTCRKNLCAQCEIIHFNEFSNYHITISNDIKKVLSNEKNFINKNINEKNYEDIEKKIKELKIFVDINNKIVYEEIINDINEIKDNENNSFFKYKRIISKSYNMNKSINDMIYALFEIILSNYKSLIKYNLNEPFKNLFSNFLINDEIKKFYKSRKNINNKNLLEKLSLYNEFFLNNFIIKKKFIYPEIKNISICKGHTSSIDCMVQLYDGRIATGSSDGSVKIWDNKNFKLIKTLKNDSSLEPIYSINQMKNNFLIYGTEGGNFAIWDINTYQKILIVKNCHSKSIWGFMNVGKNRVVSISEDETFKVYNINTFKLIRTIKLNDGMILSEWTAKDGSLITGTENGNILIWDMNNYSCKKQLKGHQLGVDYIIQLWDYRIISGAQDKKLKIWDYFTGECLATLEGHADTIESLLELKDTRIISASWDKCFKVWDVFNYQCLLTINAHDDYILVIELLKDDDIFASGSADNSLKIWKCYYNDNQIIKINK